MEVRFGMCARDPGWSDVDKETDRGNRGFGIDAQQDYQGMGAAHSEQLQGFAISVMRLITHLNAIAMPSI